MSGEITANVIRIKTILNKKKAEIQTGGVEVSKMGGLLKDTVLLHCGKYSVFCSFTFNKD